ncbi:MAG: hypothetical protein IJU12_11500 [Clostridia bacterium]|nr:hypothetical protein [Clostridia bacterium]
MAKRKRQPEKEAEKTLSEYYRLNTQAVDDLVTADESNSPQVPAAELRKYRSGPRLTLADWAKALLIKCWFAGAVCFFFLWGLGIYVTDYWDQLLVLGVALGIVTDLLTNNLFRFYAKTPGANDRWMMFPQKKFITLFLNILYAFLVLACVVATYQAVNALLIALTGAKDTVPLGVGPILFGVFVTAWDQLFITMKRTLIKIFRDARKRGE